MTGYKVTQTFDGIRNGIGVCNYNYEGSGIDLDFFSLIAGSSVSLIAQTVQSDLPGGYTNVAVSGLGEVAYKVNFAQTGQTVVEYAFAKGGFIVTIGGSSDLPLAEMDSLVHAGASSIAGRL